jgi:hypothetical protein
MAENDNKHLMNFQRRQSMTELERNDGSILTKYSVEREGGGVRLPEPLFRQKLLSKWVENNAF